MARLILEESRIHPAIREKVSTNRREIVDKVAAAVETNSVVVVGMRHNPHSNRARKALTEQSIPFVYLEFGGYWSQWRKRTALKIWTGWPTFPMVFINGMLVGGASDIEKLVTRGELKELIAQGS